MSDQADYSVLSMAGSIAYDNSLFENACQHYRQAMEIQGISETRKVSAQYSYASSLFVAGHYKESIAQFGDLYATYRDDTRYLDVVSRAYQRVLHVSLYLHFVRQPASGLLQLEKIANEGLEWLSERGNKDLFHPLLLNLSRIYFFSGKYDMALDTAEEALSQKKRYGGGFYQGTYIHNIAWITRVIKEYERCNDVIRENNSSRNDPYTNMLVDSEHLFLILEKSPIEKEIGLEVAERVFRPTTFVQSPLWVFRARGACGMLYAACGQDKEVKTAFLGIQQLLEGNHPELNRYFREEAPLYIKAAAQYLGEPDGKIIKKLDDLYDLFDTINAHCAEKPNHLWRDANDSTRMV